MDTILQELVKWGLGGILLAALLYEHWYLVRRAIPKLIADQRTDQRRARRGFFRALKSLQHDVCTRLDRIEGGHHRPEPPSHNGVGGVSPCTPSERDVA